MSRSIFKEEKLAATLTFGRLRGVAFQTAWSPRGCSKKGIWAKGFNLQLVPAVADQILKEKSGTVVWNKGLAKIRVGKVKPPWLQESIIHT